MKESRGALRALVLAAVLALALGSAAVLAACGGDDANAGASTTDKDVAAALAENSDLSMYAEAVAAAGLDETLAGTGPFTVFAAKDSAVEADGATLDETYVKASIVEGASLKPEELNGGGKNTSMLEDNDILSITGIDGGLYINTVKVVDGPIECSNGMIYILDGVIAPKE